MLAFAVAANAQGLKKRVAVMDFSVKSGGGYELGKGMADMLTTALVKSGSFIVIERQELDKVMKEQALGQSGAVSPQSAAQVGKILGVELIIVGGVTEFGQKQSEIGGGSSSSSIPRPSLPFGASAPNRASVKTSTARVGLDIRLVNSSTGEIIAAENVAEEESKAGLSAASSEFQFKNDPSFDNTLAGKAARKAIDKVVTLVSSKMAHVPWSGKILKVNSDNTVFIKPGTEGGVKNGDTFVVYSVGEEIVDPDTGEKLGAEETRSGVIKVMDAKEKMAKAAIESGTGFKAGDMVRVK
jgi:curli biogenesis system outer membrane secretion channel CsgG